MFPAVDCKTWYRLFVVIRLAGQARHEWGNRLLAMHPSEACTYGCGDTRRQVRVRFRLQKRGLPPRVPTPVDVVRRGLPTASRTHLSGRALLCRQTAAGAAVCG